MPSLGPRGEVLSQLRRSLGFTQLELAQRVGVSERTVRNAERGAAIKHDFLEFIASGLGVSVADVVAPVPPRCGNGVAYWEQNAARLLDAIRRAIVEHDASALLALADRNVVLRHEGVVPELALDHHLIREYRGVSGLSRYLMTGRQFWQACGDVDYYVETPVGGGNVVVLRCGYEVPLRSGGGYRWSRSVVIGEFAQERLVCADVFCAPGSGPPEVGLLANYSKLT